VKALKFRVKNAEGIFYTGGYDNDRDGNRKAVNDYIEKM
jgi:hypothetical protein